MESRRRVTFDFEEKEVTAYVLIPLPLINDKVSDNIALFSTNKKDLKRLKVILKFINSFNRCSKTSEILKVITDFLVFPENTKETLIFTDNYLFVRTTLRQEVLPRRQLDRLREQLDRERELQPLDLDELFDGEI